MGTGIVNIIQTLSNSNIKSDNTEYYVNSNDYKGAKLYFSNNISRFYYVVIKRNEVDNNWYVISNGSLNGYFSNSTYLYQFDFDKYINFSSNKILEEPNQLDFEVEGNSSSKIYFIISTNEDFINNNITYGYFTLLADGRVLVNNIDDVISYDYDYLINMNFWNRENGNVFNYPIQSTVENEKYYPITIYGDNSAYVILKDSSGEIIKRKIINGSNTYDYITHYIWVPSNCANLGVVEYNNSEVIDSTIQPNLINGSELITFAHNQGFEYMSQTLMTNEDEPYYRFQPITNNYFRANGLYYDYPDNTALYVVSYDIRVESDNEYAYITTFLDTDNADSTRTVSIPSFKWVRIYTMPFSRGGSDPLIISNASVDHLDKWVDLKNFKVEKVKYDKYVNYIYKGEASNVYGFAADNFYLQAGKTYTLRVIGNNSNATQGRSLFVEINRAGLEYYSRSTSEFSGGFTKSFSFTPTATGNYYISSFYHPYNPDTSGTVYLDSYYLYEGTVDPGETILPTDYIPSVSDLNSTNIKYTDNGVKCTGYKDNNYYYLTNNSSIDILSCKANAYNVQNVQKEYLNIGNKQYNYKNIINNQIKQNTGLFLNESQMYSLLKAPLIYKVNPTNKLLYPNMINTWKDEWFINTTGLTTFLLNKKLIPGKKYCLIADIIQVDYTNNNIRILLGDASSIANQNIFFNVPFIASYNSTEFIKVTIMNNYNYKPCIFRGIKLIESDSIIEYSENYNFDLANYNLDMSSFDGYNNKQLSEKNIELTLTDIESTTKRNNITTTFFD